MTAVESRGRPSPKGTSSQRPGVDLASDVTLQAGDDLGLRFTLSVRRSRRHGWANASSSGDHDPPQGMVGLAISARVETVTGKRRDRRRRTDEPGFKAAPARPADAGRTLGTRPTACFAEPRGGVSRSQVRPPPRLLTLRSRCLNAGGYQAKITLDPIIKSGAMPQAPPRWYPLAS